jgi:FkbM family methyltransferase
VLRSLRAWARRRQARRLERQGIAAVAARSPCGGLILLYGADRKITPFVLRGGEWQRREFDAFERYVSEHGLAPAVFVDVGANVGTHSIYACASNAFARVVAIEPNPLLVPLLEANLAMHARGKPFRVHAVGAHGSAGSLVLSVRHGNVGGGSLRASRRADVRQAVEVRPLDELLAEEVGSGEPIALWIDVESHEAEVLRGATALLARGAVAVCVEVRPRRTAAGDREVLERVLAGATDLVDASAGRPTSLDALFDAGTPSDLLACFPRPAPNV